MDHSKKKFVQNAIPTELKVEGRQAILPCRLTLSDGSELLCTNQIRHLPGKRLVLKGYWCGQTVFAKLFIHPRRATRHQDREWRGYQAFQQHGIITPPLLFRGQQQHHQVLLFQAIEPAKNVAEIWDSLAHQKAQSELLHRLVGLVAKHHQAGLWQQDLHLGNFLIQGDVLYSLDGADIQKGIPELGRAISFRNLGLLFAQFPLRCEGLVETAYPHYAHVRGWSEQAGDQQMLHKAIAQQRAQRKALVLKKIYRDCSAFVAHKQLNQRVIYVRSYDIPAFHALLEDIDASMGRKLLKDGATATVWETQIRDQRLVVKRYNIKNWGHGVQRAVRRTRASISWENAHRLLFFGIPTPKPVALIEQRWGPLRRISYFISEYCEATDSRTFFQQHGDDLQMVVEKIAALFSLLAQAKISHGDMKATNILIDQQKQPILIDLDALKEHSLSLAFQIAQQKDRARFLKNWKGNKALQSIFGAALEKLDY